MEILVGADIEMFISDKEQKIISAEPFIQGSKHRPFMWDEGYGI